MQRTPLPFPSTLAVTAALALLVAGCTTQTSQEQMQAREATRICVGAGCVQQSRGGGHVIAPVAPGVEDVRMRELEALAVRDPRAAYDLGLRLLRGDGVRRDASQAIDWLREAGERGVRQAQSALGRLYLFGLQEMGEDPAEAEIWLTYAAAQGDKEAEKLLPKARQARQQAQRDYQQEHNRQRQSHEDMARRAAEHAQMLELIKSMPYLWQWQQSGQLWKPVPGLSGAVGGR